MIHKQTLTHPLVKYYILYYIYIQDPEMMREAKKMMADPAFQEQCKQYTENEAFQSHLAKTKADLQDANKVKEMEEHMKLRVEAGEKELTELLAQSTLLNDTIADKNDNDDDNNKQSTEASDELKVRNFDSIVNVHIHAIWAF